MKCSTCLQGVNEVWTRVTVRSRFTASLSSGEACVHSATRGYCNQMKAKVWFAVRLEALQRHYEQADVTLIMVRKPKRDGGSRNQEAG
jgi:hypothetical protein